MPPGRDSLAGDIMHNADFDETCIRALTEDLGEEVGREILGVFFSDVGGDLNFLSQVGCEGNRNLIHYRAHAISSAAVAFGFNQVSRLARQLGADAATMSPADFKLRIAALSEAFAVARQRIFPLEK